MLIVDIPETRGTKPEHDFRTMKLGEKRTFKNTSSANILNRANSQAKTKKLPYKFKVYTIDKLVTIVRIE